MSGIFSEAERQALRKRLVAAIDTSNTERSGPLTDDTSLIKTGLLDSLGLFNVAVCIEREIGRPLDVATFELAEEWDTIADMINFIQRMRTAG